MKRSEWVAVIFAASILTLALIMVYVLATQTNASTPTQENNQKRFYLGDLIYQTDEHDFYFHGFDNTNLVIGHYINYFREGGMSNIHVYPCREGTIFRLKNRVFTVIACEYSGVVWVELNWTDAET